MQAITIATVVLAALFSPISAQEVATGTRGNATVVENNPPGETYVATLPNKAFFNPSNPRGNVRGSISATANLNGIGVRFSVQFENLPTSGGPFSYHLHDQPVPADGNCTKTLAHLDPFIRGEATPCESRIPQTCQVGDLSGKTENVQSDPFVANYVDDFASTTPGLGSFFGNRSFVIHFANKTRITCANFVLEGSNGGSNGGNGGGNSTPTTAPTQSTGTPTASPSKFTGTPTNRPSQFTGGASMNAVSAGTIAGVMAAALLL